MTGPITVFDKSFLQSLSIDESVWFDHFFPPVVCPLFYVETLADLGKPGLERGAALREVAVIADKFPDMHGTPCIHHATLCAANLLGHEVPLTGQVPVARGRWVATDNRTGVVFDDSPEAAAFSRWQNQDFSELEHDFAQSWRKALSTLNLEEVAQALRALGLDAKTVRSVEDAKRVAGQVVMDRSHHFDRMKLAMLFLGVPPHYHTEIMKRWSLFGYPPLAEYAPYAAHVVSVEVFFQVALAANLIGTHRASNRVDIAYLFYVPFCMLFVSSDKLHRKCAPVFLRTNQRFIWGPDLKADLRKINAHYLEHFSSRVEEGVMSLADGPPRTGDFLVSTIWDALIPGWRRATPPSLGKESKEIVEDLQRFLKAPEAPPEKVPDRSADADVMALRRRVRPRKGAWWQVPKSALPRQD